MEAELLPPEKYDHATEQDRRADLSATLHSGVAYKDIRPGMDVTVHIGGYGVKDDIVIRNREAARYAGILLPGGFAYKAEEDGNIHAWLKDEDYITVFAPYAFDAEGNDVEVKAVLTEKENGCELRYVFEEENAVYPVTIDPQISYSKTKE